MTNEEELQRPWILPATWAAPPAQVERFLKEVIAPVLEENKELLGVKAEINV